MPPPGWECGCQDFGGVGSRGAYARYRPSGDRRRHIRALDEAAEHFSQGREALQISKAGELLAEELRLSQQALGEITGAVSSDDLLGRIFSEFCIGK